MRTRKRGLVEVDTRGAAVRSKLTLVKWVSARGNKRAGYDLGDVRENLSAKEWGAFCQWFAGQTGILHEGRMIISRGDLDRFLRGQEPFD